MPAPRQNQRKAAPEKAAEASPAAELRATLLLRRPHPLPEAHESLGRHQPHRRTHLSSRDFSSQHSALAADVRRVRRFARQHGLRVEAVRARSRQVVLAGDDAAMRTLFAPRGKRSITVPAALAECVEAVFGVHLQSAAVRRSRRWHKPSRPAPRRGVGKSVQPTFAQIEAAYAFPPATDGAGQCIAILEFGGGYRRQDLQDFFTALGRPMPKITDVSVDGAGNQPAGVEQVHEFLDILEGKRPKPRTAAALAAIEPAQCTVEATMDIQLAGALAPGARIVVYFAPPSEAGIVHALAAALHDRRHAPSIIAISWGEAEPSFSDSFLEQVDRLLHDAAHLGITVCASSGDDGAKDGSPDGKPAVNFPASSPHCLGCGGTTARFGAAGILGEQVWNAVRHGIPGATGGGLSRRFGVPAWQSHLKLPANPLKQPGRGVPDVAGPADPISGPQILVAGRPTVAWGTSAVVPFWAALIARLNQALQRHTPGARCGYLNSQLYQLAASANPPFRPILKGANGGYAAAPGWNPCTGLGSPIGERLLARLAPTRR